MGLGTSIFLIAVGAILKYAVTAQNENVDIQAVGVILMVVGIAGACLSLFFWSSWGGFGTYGRTRTAVYDDAPPAVPAPPVYDDGQVIGETPTGRPVVAQPGYYADGRPRRVVVEEVRREGL